MSTAVKRGPPKPILVAPNVTDPHMRSKKTQAETLLGEDLSEEDMSNVVFNSGVTTKEEQTAVVAPSSDNTIIIIICALVVITLVAVVVWMVMKQSSEEEKKEGAEVRRMLQQQHPRNGMPQMSKRQPAVQLDPNRMAAIQREQHQLQQQLSKVQEDLEPGETGEGNADDSGDAQPAKASKPKSFADAMAAKEGKVVPNIDLADEEPAPDPAKKTFTKDKPHPSVMRPGKPADDDVADVSARLAAMLSSTNTDTEPKKTVKSVTKKPATKQAAPKQNAKSDNAELDNSDRALLDKVSANVEDDESDDE